MKYIEKTLLSGESVFFCTRKHWIIFILPIIFTVFGLLFWVQQDLLILLGYLFFVLAIYYWFTAITTFITSEFAITNKRVLIKVGFIQRQSWETLLSKIASLEVKQSILGRLLGYGTLVIQSTGGGKDAFTVINDPLNFRRKVQEQTELMQVNLSINQVGQELKKDQNVASTNAEPVNPQSTRERL